MKMKALEPGSVRGVAAYGRLGPQDDFREVQLGRRGRAAVPHIREVWGGVTIH